MSLLIISKTFEVITPESAEHGDFADHGFEWEDRPMTFRELLRELKDYTSLSSGGTGIDETWCRKNHVWACQTDGDVNFRDGSTTSYALHCDDTDPRARRWWAKALRVAKLVKP